MGRIELKSTSKIDLSHVRIKEYSWIAKIAAAKLKTNTVAIVLGRTIHLHGVNKENFLQNERWVRHEACHVRQFENNGYFNFIIKYLWQSFLNGYYNNKYELEARLCEEN